ncbi:hypothetical protein PAPHI01_0641 [Pancytospora philotis]|nr:hypothetical protein PAPHI01_0641 [Pancytospora philotis]
MADEVHTNLLDSHTPAAVLEIFGGFDDCTDALVELIKGSSQQQLKKLRQIFLAVDNYRMDEVYAVTQSPNRRHRYTATYLVLSRMKALCKKRTSFAQIEEMYDNVFVVRFLDVDPLIRGMAVQFISEFISDNPVLRHTDYLKYIGWALNDKSDSVRRRAVRSMARLLAAYKKSRGSSTNEKENRTARAGKKAAAPGDLELFFTKYKDRVIQMAALDTNAWIQREASALALRMFSEADILPVDEALCVLALAHARTVESEAAVRKILPEGLWDLERVHEVYDKAGGSVFKHLVLDKSDIDSFVLSVVNFIRDMSVCCDSPSICYIDVIKQLCSDVDPVIFMPLLEVTKDNRANAVKIIECLLRLDNLKEHSSAVHEIVSFIKGTAYTDERVFEQFIALIKKLEDGYEHLCGELVEEISAIYSSDPTKRFMLLPLIKCFDVPSLVTSEAASACKCYAALWLVARGLFPLVEQIEFSDAEHLITLIDFLTFFSNHAGFTSPEALGADIDGCMRAAIVDEESAFKHLYYKLHGLIAKNLVFEDEDACFGLYKLVEMGIFTESADIFFRRCCLERLQQLVAMTRQPRALAIGFFKVVAQDKKLRVLAKLLAARLSRSEPDRFVFTRVKELMSDKSLLDTVLVHFVPLLTANEAIVLENLAPKSKFKTALHRLSTGRAASKRVEEETVTII